MVSARLNRDHAPQAALGQMLATARQQRHLTWPHIADLIQIPVAHLRALEEGDISVFAAEVYARGAYLKYAKFLQIQEAIDMPAFSRALCQAREAVPLRVPHPPAWWQWFVTPRRLFMSLLVVFALVGGSYIAWQVQSFLRLPALEVSQPTSSTVNSEMVLVAGQAQVGATVLINEEPVLLESDGSFSLSLPLHPGVNVVEVAAANAAGRSRVIKKDLLVPRQQR